MENNQDERLSVQESLVKDHVLKQIVKLADDYFPLKEQYTYLEKNRTSVNAPTNYELKTKMTDLYKKCRIKIGEIKIENIPS